MSAVSLRLFPNFFLHLTNKLIDLDTDVIRATLHTNADPPSDADDFFNDVTGELATALGYTDNGIALSNKSLTLVAANSWAKVHATSTAYSVGEIVRPSTGNGFVYRAATAGTTAGAAPSFPTTVGTTVVDGGVTWTNVGTQVLRFTADPLVWAAPFSATFRHIIFRDASPGTDATDPLIGYVSYGSDITGLDGAYTITPDSAGGYFSIPIV